MKAHVKTVAAILLWATLMVSCKETPKTEEGETLHTDRTFTNEGITDTVVRGEAQYQDTVNAVREEGASTKP